MAVLAVRAMLPAGARTVPETSMVPASRLSEPPALGGASGVADVAAPFSVRPWPLASMVKRVSEAG